MHLLLIWFYAVLIKSPKEWTEVPTWLWETGSVLTVTMLSPEHSQALLREKGIPSGLETSALHSLHCTAWAVHFTHAWLWSEQQQDYSSALKVSTHGSPLWVRISLFIHFCVISCVDMDPSWAWSTWSLKMTSSPGVHISPAPSLTGFFQADPWTGKSLLTQSHISLQWITTFLFKKVYTVISMRMDP